MRELLIACLLVMLPASLSANPAGWAREWPHTDFDKASIDFSEILEGGPPKDGIPPIDEPTFLPVAEETTLEPQEPVIGLQIDGEARAYPLRVLMWHEIVNDELGGVPVAVTYCPLCNAAIAFDRRLDGDVLDFGTTGKLRNSDLVMYDRQSESWWQQYSGEAIVGSRTGESLDMLPARLESWANFQARAPEGSVLQPPGKRRRYGANPYVGYDSAAFPFLYKGEVPDGVRPLARVVVVDDEAWTLEHLREVGRIETDEHVIAWSPGQSSALDTRTLAEGRDVGNVLVQRKTGQDLQDDVHHVTFAFVFHAFEPEGILHR